MLFLWHLANEHSNAEIDLEKMDQGRRITFS